MGKKKSRKQYRYSIEINESFKHESNSENSNNEKYTVFFGKNFGNMYGGCYCCGSIGLLKESLRAIVAEWEEFDYILGRIPDRVTDKNLYFKSFTPEITISNALGIQALDNWIK